MGGTEGNNSTAAGKRCRDPEDEVYVDNLNSHKRYLSEIMASSMNGLSVGDTLSHNNMESPARDDVSSQYSPMSEDSDDSRYYESHSQTESVPTSPVSPCRYLKTAPGFPPNLPASSYSSAPSPNPRQRNSDAEGNSSRFPSSPSDICHSADLRKAALLRSVQMRAQPPLESEERCSFSYTKAAAAAAAAASVAVVVVVADDERERGKARCEAETYSKKGGGNKAVSCRSLDMKAEGDEPSAAAE